MGYARQRLRVAMGPTRGDSPFTAAAAANHGCATSANSAAAAAAAASANSAGCPGCVVCANSAARGQQTTTTTAVVRLACLCRVCTHYIFRHRGCHASVAEQYRPHAKKD